jgi:hypothetical protein
MLSSTLAMRSSRAIVYAESKFGADPAGDEH